MANPTSKKALDFERFEARISADKKNLLKSAANLSGRTLTDFVINSAYEVAVRVIKENQQLHLSTKDQNIFIKTILNPPLPSDNLLKAAKFYKKDVASK